MRTFSLTCDTTQARSVDPDMMPNRIRSCGVFTCQEQKKLAGGGKHISSLNGTTTVPVVVALGAMVLFASVTSQPTKA